LLGIPSRHIAYPHRRWSEGATKIQIRRHGRDAEEKLGARFEHMNKLIADEAARTSKQ